ncbi:MAG: type I-E CRISPR-associated protein Cas6/Cse3/CasE [Planctomycetes bacterium]|nr:type I-E CRISPR-associated protein Cas6/Cse3/CasE [Planctomycetota bacterium]MCW8134424.1 type I-E CRISPR-associated protein Cas6/Cse3/CasE [Planctomycetota bacterium]
MYHSHLLINTGDNPDRVDWQRTRAWLRNLYRVHQRLCMAFPDADTALVGKSEAERFAEYCKPFQPPLGPDAIDATDDDPGDVHTPRTGERGFLYRIDYPVLGSMRKPVIIVQSATRPDWDHAFGLNPGSGARPFTPPKGNADFLLAAPPQVRRVEFESFGGALHLKAWELDRYDDSATLPDASRAHAAQPGDELWFLLRANVIETRAGKDGKRGRHRLRIDDGLMRAYEDATTTEARQEAARRVEEARREVHLDWLQRKLGGAAELVRKTLDDPKREHPLVETGWAHASRGDYDRGGKTAKEDMKWWAVTYKGKLIVKDPVKLRSLIMSGIGPAKAFGFGLLSVAPVLE